MQPLSCWFVFSDDGTALLSSFAASHGRH
jgi:hypothetical protein